IIPRSFPFRTSGPAISPSREFLAGEEGLEPPYPVLETGVLAVGRLPFTLSQRSGRRVDSSKNLLRFFSPGPISSGRPLLHFLVSRVFPARIAKLLGFQTLGMLLLILRRRVIPVLAITALQSNDFPHDLIPSSNLSSAAALAETALLNNLGDGAGADGVAAFANRESQPLLQS